MEEYIKQLPELISKYESKPILASSILFLLGPLLPLKILEQLDIYIEFKIKIYIIIGLSIVLIYLIYYFCKYKKYSKFKKDEIGIIFSFNYDKDSINELKELYHNFSSLVKKQGLQDKIKIWATPKKMSVFKEKSAYKLRDRTSAKLIIWGDVKTGTEKSKERTLLKPIKFSFRVYLNEKDGQILSHHFSSNIQNKYWFVEKNNTLIDREYLASNLHSISIYIIATLLFIERDYENSEILLKSLFEELKDSANNLILLNTKFLLKQIIRIKTLSLNLWLNSKNQSVEIIKAKELVEKNNYYGFKIESLLLKAMISFLENKDKNECFIYLNQAYQLNKEDSGSLFSLAFCHFYIGNIKPGWKYFKKVLKIEKENKTSTHRQILNIARWYEESLKENGKEFLEFPLGMIYFKLFGKDGLILAKECFEKFIKNNKEEKTFKIFILRAEKNIKKIDEKYYNKPISEKF